MKKRLLIFLVTVVFMGPLVLFAAAPPAKDVKVKKTGSKKPAVTFSHTNHDKKGIKDCDACHEAAKSKKASHKYCKGCHKTKKGPTSCKKCHKK